MEPTQVAGRPVLGWFDRNEFHQWFPDVTPLSDGRFVVVYEELLVDEEIGAGGAE